MDALEILEQLAAHGTPSSGVARRIDVGSASYLQFFEQELLEDLIEAGASACRIFEGGYGAGKTHLLQLLSDAAEERGAAVVRADLSQDLHLSDWRSLIQHILQELRMVDTNEEVHRGLPDILMDFGWPPSGEDSLRNLRVPHTGFRDAIRAVVYSDLEPDAVQLLRRFLLGEAVRISDLRRHGVKGVKGSVTSRNAERVLQTLGMCLQALGVPALVVLFDETEHTLTHRRPSSDTLAANLLRRLIDGSTSGRLTSTFIGFAVLPGTIEQAALVYPALGQRIRVTERSDGGFRRPVLDIAQINTSRTAIQFLDGAIERITILAAEIADPPPDFVDRLRGEGLAIIDAHASGYRRPLFKALATTALRYV